MLVLGIHTGHNATAFLLHNGSVIGGLSQEKLNNIKNSADFPAQVIRALLSETGHKLTDIEQIAIAGHQVFPVRCYDYLFEPQVHDGAQRTGLAGFIRKLETYLPRIVFGPLFTLLRNFRQKALLNEGRRELFQNLTALGLGKVKVVYVDHHTCHARAAFHAFGGKGPALIFTADGSGDGQSATLTHVDANGIWELLGASPQTASLGGIYSSTTRFLGMRPLEHEYKVMGLAPYAKGYADSLYNRVFEPVIDLDPENPYRFRSALNCTRFYDHLTRTAVGERFDNIAAAAQRLIEERVMAWVKDAVQRTGIRNAYFGGGLFMNVKLNMRIQELTCLESIHFLPSCGDESNALGAAYAIQHTHHAPVPLHDLYLGLSFNADEIKRVLERYDVYSRFTVERPHNMTETISTLLANGEIVARFDGRNEWGARSLGNRAILAHPGRMESFFTVNDQIKCRDFWMPFAPTVLDTAAPRYLKNWSITRTPAPHMITAFHATELGRSELCAAVHRGDGTLRPQVLTHDINPQYYELIKAFEEKTGIGAVLNTSFNLHGKPLVATPDQALDTLEQSGLRHLVMGPFLISKT